MPTGGFTPDPPKQWQKGASTTGKTGNNAETSQAGHGVSDGPRVGYSQPTLPEVVTSVDRPTVDSVLQMFKTARPGATLQPLMEKIGQLDRAGRYADLDAIAEGLLKPGASPQITGRGLFYLALNTRQSESRSIADYIKVREQWLKALPKSVTARVLLANAFIEWGAEARGGGYANTVSAEAWRLLAQRVEVASQYLREAEKLTHRDVMLYVTWMNVALYQSWPRDRRYALFEKAFAADPHETRLYTSMATQLLPRWFGAPGELGKFADMCARRRGNYRAYAAMGLLAVQYDHEKAYSVDGIQWAKVRKGLEDTHQDNGPPEALNEMLAAACLADDRATALKLYQKLGTNVNMQYLTSMGATRHLQQWTGGH